MDRNKVKVGLLGATGLVGHHLLQQLLKDERVIEIHLIGRRHPDIHTPKVFFHSTDLTEKERMVEILKTLALDVGFCALGTTIKKAGSQEAFYKVDHDYVLNAARAMKETGVKTFCLISSAGADSSSKAFYLRVKGEIEADVKKLGFERLIIKRPGPLLGKRKEWRTSEELLKFVAPLIIPLFRGKFRNYRPIQSEEVAASLIAEAFQN